MFACIVVVVCGFRFILVLLLVLVYLGLIVGLNARLSCLC